MRKLGSKRLNTVKTAAAVAISLLCAWTSATEATHAGESPSSPADADGTLQFHGGMVAAGVGYMWGDGTLSFGESRHRFTLSGLSILDVGAAELSARGNVYHLKQLSDFDGNYVAVSAGAALAGGGGAIYLRNPRGVVIKLTSTDIGLRMNLGPDGINISLND